MKVAIITGSRADWNGLGMVGKCLRDEHNVTVDVIAIGQHADNSEHLQTVIADGFDPQVKATNLGEDMAMGMGVATVATAAAIDKIRPDMVLVLGDRFEILGAAAACALRGVPLAHIGGGDITEGSVDNKLRYAITALADLHFPTNSDSAVNTGLCARDLETVHTVGNPALDRIRITEIVQRETLHSRLNLKQSKRNIIVAYHSVTTEPDNGVGGCMEMIRALGQIEDCSILVLGTNVDSGSSRVTAELQALACKWPFGQYAMWDNLPPESFYSALTHFDCMVGNSSAGLVETAGFGIPVVNIGDRQKGRLMANNVQRAEPNARDIELALRYMLSQHRIRYENPYGDGHSAPRIAKIIVDALQ